MRSTLYLFVLQVLIAGGSYWGYITHEHAHYAPPVHYLQSVANGVFCLIVPVLWMRMVFICTWGLDMLTSLLGGWPGLTVETLLFPFGAFFLYRFFKSDDNWRERLSWDAPVAIATGDAIWGGVMMAISVIPMAMYFSKENLIGGLIVVGVLFLMKVNKLVASLLLLLFGILESGLTLATQHSQVLVGWVVPIFMRGLLLYLWARSTYAAYRNRV